MCWWLIGFRWSRAPFRRCHANQTVDVEQMVDPFLCFAVEKTSMGRTQDRILKFDLTRKVVANWAKDELHKEFAFDTITGVTTLSDKPFDVSLTIRSTSKRYDFSCRTTSELQRLVRLLQGIVTRSLCCRTNDAIVPSRPLLRAQVDKAGSFGRWHRRCVRRSSSTLTCLS
jgi:hypothetical protein